MLIMINESFEINTGTSLQYPGEILEEVFDFSRYLIFGSAIFRVSTWDNPLQEKLYQIQQHTTTIQTTVLVTYSTQTFLL